MKRLILIYSFALGLSLSMNAQVRQANSPTIGVAANSSAFLDASSTNSWNSSTNIGKGLLYPRVRLSLFNFSTSGTPGIPNNYPTYFDGFVVYNTDTTGTALIGITQGGSLSRGFWYYENKSANLAGGTWKLVGTSQTDVINTIKANGQALTGNGIIITGGDSAVLKATNLRLDSIAVAKMMNQSPIKDSVIQVMIAGAGRDSIIRTISTSTIFRDSIIRTVNTQIVTGAVVGQDLTSGNGIIVTGGAGTSLKATSLRLDSIAVAKMMTQSPVRDSVIRTVISSTIFRDSVIKQASSVSVKSNNGLSMSTDTVQLGGSLVKPTTITTTGSNTLAITGLQTGVAGDSLVALGANGVLRKLSVSAVVSGDNWGSQTAAVSAPLTGNGTSGSPLSVTRSNTTGGRLVTVTNGTNATFTAMTVSVDTVAMNTFISNNVTQSPIKDSISTTITNIINNNGVTGQNTTGGNLVTVTNGTGASLKAMTVSVNTAALKDTVAKFVTQSPVRDSVIRTVISSTIFRDSVIKQASSVSVKSNNGLSMSTDTVQLGGSLVKPTTITTTGSNTLAITGLQTGVAGDSLVALGANGVLRKLSVSAVVSGDNWGSQTAAVSAPLTGNGTSGSPLSVTRSNTTGGSLVTVTNGTNATFTAMTVSVNTAALKDTVASFVTQSPVRDSVIRTVISSTIFRDSVIKQASSVSVKSNNGLSMSTDTVQLGGSLVKPTTITTSATNTLALAGLQSGASSDSILVVNPTTGVIGRKSPSTITTTNTSSFNTTTRVLTNTVNGIAANVTLPSSNDSTTSSNGLTMTGKDVRLGGTLTGATTVTTSAANTLALAGLQSGASSDSILVVNPTTGVIGRKSPSTITTTNTSSFNSTTRVLTNTVNGIAATVTVPGSNDSTTSSNGLTMTGKDVRLGGTLTGATTVTTSATNTLALAGLQSGGTSDSILTINPTTSVVTRKTAVNAMDPRMKFFYAPSISIPVTATGTGFTVNLYDQYTDNFSTPAVKNPTAPAAIPVFAASELNYYISSFDPAVFANVSISDLGVMTYDVISTTPSYCSFVNVIFSIK